MPSTAAPSSHARRQLALRGWSLLATLAILGAAGAAGAQRLFVGLEGSSPPTKSTDLAGFPAVAWETLFPFDVSGAAATPGGELYVCNGSFTTNLYRATLDMSPPQYLCTLSVDIHALAHDGTTLYGYSNYASPKGIYAIDTVTGQATLVLDVYTGTGFLFFALDYNPADGLFYGYTEYGASGLYSIDLDSGAMLRVVGPIPAANSQGRGLAVGQNTVYLTATRGDDGIPLYAYDLSQGANGQWVGFTNPYPQYHSTGGAAWIPAPSAAPEIGVHGAQPRIDGIWPNPMRAGATVAFSIERAGAVRLRVYTPGGRALGELLDGERAAGAHDFTWDGRIEGRPLPAGVYLLRLETAAGASARRLLVLH